MSFEAFWSAISRLVPLDPLSGREAELARLDPYKIYVENVRSVLGVSSSRAKRICETAVRQGLFSRCVEVSCPDGAIATSAQSEEELPEMVHCWQEEEGGLQEVEIATRRLPKTIFYRLKSDVQTATTGSHASTA